MKSKIVQVTFKASNILRIMVFNIRTWCTITVLLTGSILVTRAVPPGGNKTSYRPLATAAGESRTSISTTKNNRAFARNISDTPRASLNQYDSGTENASPTPVSVHQAPGSVFQTGFSFSKPIPSGNSARGDKDKQKKVRYLNVSWHDVQKQNQDRLRQWDECLSEIEKPLTNGSETYEEILSLWRHQTDGPVVNIGPVSLLARDLASLIPPKYKSDLNFNGWLSAGVIEAFLQKLHDDRREVFYVEATLCQLVQRQARANTNFDGVKTIFIPMNIPGTHWTLLVSDREKNLRVYLDPANDQPRAITSESYLGSIIDNISRVVDIRTGWNSTAWPCKEPAHFVQKDNYSCGVLICLFARCYTQGERLDQPFDLDRERQQIASIVLKEATIKPDCQRHSLSILL